MTWMLGEVLDVEVVEPNQPTEEDGTEQNMVAYKINLNAIEKLLLELSCPLGTPPPLWGLIHVDIARLDVVDGRIFGVMREWRPYQVPAEEEGKDVE